MKNTIAFLFCILLFSCNKKEIKQVEVNQSKVYVTDTVVYNLVNDILKIPEYKPDSSLYMSNNASLFLFDLSMDGEEFYSYAKKYFGTIDSTMIEKQVQKSRNSFYKEEMLHDVRLFDYDHTSVKSNKQLDSLNEVVFSKREHSIWVSLPIFNPQKDVAFVSYSYECGYLCGYSVYLILKKIDNKWEIVDSYNLTIS